MTSAMIALGGDMAASAAMSPTSTSTTATSPNEPTRESRITSRRRATSPAPNRPSAASASCQLVARHDAGAHLVRHDTPATCPQSPHPLRPRAPALCSARPPAEELGAPKCQAVDHDEAARRCRAYRPEHIESGLHRL